MLKRPTTRLWTTTTRSKRCDYYDTAGILRKRDPGFFFGPCGIIDAKGKMRTNKSGSAVLFASDIPTHDYFLFPEL